MDARAGQKFSAAAVPAGAVMDWRYSCRWSAGCPGCTGLSPLLMS